MAEKFPRSNRLHNTVVSDMANHHLINDMRIREARPLILTPIWTGGRQRSGIRKYRLLVRVYYQHEGIRKNEDEGAIFLLSSKVWYMGTHHNPPGGAEEGRLPFLPLNLHPHKLLLPQ
jgi:hypothetical protein